MKAHLLVNTLY